MTGNAPALEKGLKVLEFLMAANEPCTLSRIAEGVGYKVSEIQRMVDYLARDGYIVKTAAGAYHPGIRAFAFMGLNLESSLISRSEGPLRRYANRTSESVHLCVLVESMLHVVYDADGRGTVRVSIKPGLYDAGDTVSGRLLLAYREPEREGAAELRQKALAFGQVACIQGVYIVSVAVPLGDDPCAAAIASPYFLKAGQAAPYMREDLVSELRATAAEITALF
jgi:DNA-binding IclR family transcriptional regulator